MIASSWRYFEVVKQLIEEGADVMIFTRKSRHADSVQLTVSTSGNRLEGTIQTTDRINTGGGSNDGKR